MQWQTLGWRETKKTLAVSGEETMQSAADRNGAKAQKASPGLFDLWRVNKLFKIKSVHKYRPVFMPLS